MEYMSFYLFAAVFILLLIGYPVAFTLAGTALIFSVIGEMTGTFDPAFLEALPNRLYGIIGNQILMAVPLFVFMGVMLERSKIADEFAARAQGGFRFVTDNSNTTSNDTYS